MRESSDGENSTTIVIKRQEIPLKCCCPATFCHQWMAPAGPIEGADFNWQLVQGTADIGIEYIDATRRQRMRRP
jgi:hypothetical protein